jgi:hypothetical protein
VGRKPYERCVRLCAFAAVYWEAFDGKLASSAVDPLSLPFDRFLNTIYWFVIDENRGGGMERASLDETMKLVDAQLSAPLPNSRRPVSQKVIDDEMAIFHQAQAQMAASNGR